ncbi:hypothetical protein [Pedobacter duraquae]|uniref:DUF1574 domain-containing protein n=1 Tax=Pedobacter duraquae TaxID=425511 RepID=A0A4R6IEX6_9SPHI|nr:hypothetical protein [Pedobacter duraquae]TDO20218.1 hypothetical protein CLV32_3978 [Pedobacter duraquae]
MKRFLLNLLLFVAIVLSLAVIGVLLPATPRSSRSLLFEKIRKDSLLVHVPAPRIIFVGGSNLGLGLNSELIKDSLKLNPINTAIQANIGLIYMLDHTVPYIKPGDIIVVAPEYHQFYDAYAYGREELLRTVLDVSPEDAGKLRHQQWVSIYPFIPKYIFSKFKPDEYFFFKDDVIYSVSSYNRFGDAVAHWNMERQHFDPDGPFGKVFNPAVVQSLVTFRDLVQQKGGRLLITFPGYEVTSFDKNSVQVDSIEASLKANHFTLLGTPARYKMPDSLFFNTNYHLTKQGTDYRTKLLIQDLRKVLP